VRTSEYGAPGAARKAIWNEKRSEIPISTLPTNTTFPIASLCSEAKHKIVVAYGVIRGCGTRGMVLWLLLFFIIIIRSWQVMEGKSGATILYYGNYTHLLTCVGQIMSS